MRVWPVGYTAPGAVAGGLDCQRPAAVRGAPRSILRGRQAAL